MLPQAYFTRLVSSSRLRSSLAPSSSLRRSRLAPRSRLALPWVLQTNKQNKTFTYCPPSFGVDPACFNALAMSDFWARMPPFRDSIFLPSVRFLGSLRSECLFLGYVCFSLVSLLVVGSVVGCSVLPSVVRRLVVRRPVGRCRRSSCRRLSVVGRCRRPSVAGRRWSCRSSVVRFPSRSFGFRTVEGLSPQQPSTTVAPSVFFRLQGYSLSASFPPLGFS